MAQNTKLTLSRELSHFWVEYDDLKKLGEQLLRITYVDL